jgi:hypothetical protein
VSFELNITPYVFVKDVWAEVAHPSGTSFVFMIAKGSVVSAQLIQSLSNVISLHTGSGLRLSGIPLGAVKAIEASPADPVFIRPLKAVLSAYKMLFGGSPLGSDVANKLLEVIVAYGVSLRRMGFTASGLEAFDAVFAAAGFKGWGFRYDTVTCKTPYDVRLIECSAETKASK